MSLLSGVFYQKPTNQPVKPTHSVVYCCIKRRNVSPKHTTRPLGYLSQYFFPLSSSPDTPLARKVRAFTAYGIMYDTTISSKQQYQIRQTFGGKTCHPERSEGSRSPTQRHAGNTYQ